MPSQPAEPEDLNLSEKEMEEQFKAFQLSQQAYLEDTFKWLIDFVSSYFPEDQLAIRDLDLEIHFIHKVVEGGKPLGAVVYRFRKFVNKKDYFAEMGEDYKEGLELPEVLFVDSETSQFTLSEALQPEGNFVEIPPEKLTGKIKDLRDDLKRRAKVKQLKESL
jgi:hypothetical protein